MRIDGNSGNNRIKGTDGSDILVGHGGNDKLFGGRGGDILNGMNGNDKMVGGYGSDVFVFDDGLDKIVDFKPGIDHIVIDSDLGAKNFRQLKHDMSNHHGNVVIAFNDHDQLKIKDCKIRDLHAGDFDFF